MNIPYVFKRCTKCGEWLVVNTVNFSKKKGGKYGLRADCKECRSKYNKEYYKINEEAIKEQNKEYYKVNKEACKERKKRYYEANKEYIKERDKKYYEQNKEAIAERKKGYSKKYYKQNKEAIAKQNRQYYEQNKEHKAEYGRQYREINKEAIAERMKKYCEQNKEAIAEINRRYYKANKEAIAEYGRQYRQSPQGQVVAFNKANKRRAKEQNQGSGITKEQWIECMKFFEFRCAYSGIQLNKDNRSIDHIEPLNQGGEHEIWNLVPMDRGLNSSKNDKDMLEWYKEQSFYSEERLQKIYEWQEYAYNKWHNKEEIV